ncbi:MAG TPA: 4-alpha-glucanotransferase [Burkholderiales bacterium]|nr:4-alpha-glucanotransferase [Burkholderiales bacterium]
MSFERASGILLHPTSLPSGGGIGDLGPAAYEFVDFLAAGRQGLWQVLPLGPPGKCNSPYSATSAFAGNPLLISLERLADRGWIERERLEELPNGGSAVDFEEVRTVKLPLLRDAACHFLEHSRPREQERFRRFCQENAAWLDDFVLFDVLRQLYRTESWSRWPRELARREPEALQKARRGLSRELDVARAIQFAFFEQWRALHRRCAELGIKVIGDVAIFVSYGSADVWTHPDIFHLDDQLDPYVVAGVPPDAFSATGQRWGNPLYRWDMLKGRGYDWWVDRMRAALGTCDIVRLDHFLGFHNYWEIPASEPTAVHGRWVDGPRDDLFQVLRKELGDLPLIAEDLGLITDEVRALRQRLELPGMRVMQFGFGNAGAHIYLPHQFERNTVVYTGTHDNDTLLGWWQSSATEQERCHASAYLGHDPEGMNWAFIRGAQASVADLCVVPLQDVLGLGSEARMNVPSRPDGNWTWRFEHGALRPELASRLATIAEVSDRNHRVSAARQQGQGKMSEEFAA